MTNERGALFWLVVLAALVCMLTTEFFAQRAHPYSLENSTQVWQRSSNPVASLGEKEAAFAAARQNLKACCILSDKADWGTLREVGFLKGRSQNYISLTVRIPNRQGKSIPRHWIFTLEPASNVVLNKVEQIPKSQ